MPTKHTGTKSAQFLWPSWGQRWTSLARFKRLDAPAQFGAAASLAAILRPSGPGAPWKCCEMACGSR
jgi:hypothetical protein